MPATPCRVELELPPDAESVHRAREQVGELARGRGFDADGVALAVSEAVTNAVIHAFRGIEAGTVTVEAELQGENLLVEVSDDGLGMRPNTESPGLGLGLPLIGSVADGVEIQRLDPGTRLRMRFEPAA